MGRGRPKGRKDSYKRTRRTNAQLGKASKSKTSAASKKRRSTSPKRGRGRPAKLPTMKMLQIKGKKKAFRRTSIHSSKPSAKRAAGVGYYTRIVKGGNRYGVYRRKK